MEEKFGLLKSVALNIGEEIQNLAALRFLPEVDYYVNKERIDKFKTKNNEKIKLIMNGWYMWEPKHFNPSKNIEPLLVSMHIRPDIYKKFLNKKSKNFLLKNGPVGCRDLDTLAYLERNSIPAYFSGCLTLTLQKAANVKRQDYVLCVNIPDEIYNEIKTRTNRPCYNISKIITPFECYEDRLKIAKNFLWLFQSAHCVVSSNIHTVLPAIALETPALFLNNRDFNDRGRMNGLLELCNYMAAEKFFENKNSYDFENPTKNPAKYLEIREQLINICSKFTGYNNTNSLFTKDDLLTGEVNKLIQIISYLNFGYFKSLKRFLFFAEPKDLFKTFIKIISGIKTRHDMYGSDKRSLYAEPQTLAGVERERERERESNKPNGLL